ncbi:MAG TPA: substrate-binding domain-containing protein [Nitrospiraceae bacterium]|jgi:molybdate-binding protein/DNA-binding XRE family transcriptional regulator
MGENNKAESLSHFDNRLKALRVAKELTQGALAEVAGVTRQAIHAIEANQYLPTTAVALRLADALACRVEDLFSLATGREVVDADLIVPLTATSTRTRVTLARVGGRVLARPVASLGEVLNFTVAADGLIAGRASKSRRVRVHLLRDRRLIEETVVIAGCDPAIQLAADHLRRRHNPGNVLEWTMGSAAAVDALKRREVHIAGLHVVDRRSGESNLPYLREHLKGHDVTVLTFAAWQQGLMVKRGNPKGVRGVEDLVRRDVKIMNRERGSGARFLLDQQLAGAAITTGRVRGYQQLAKSHLEVARAIAEGRGDAGMGVQAAASLLGLDFVPLQDERYDLVIPTAYLSAHHGVSRLLETIVSRPFRAEVEALGGYDMRETGKVQVLGKP